jgi:hypothetical protein
MIQSIRDDRAGGFVLGYLLAAVSYGISAGGFLLFVRDLPFDEAGSTLSRAFRLFAIGAFVFAGSNLLFIIVYTHNHVHAGYFVATGAELIANLALGAGWWLWSVQGALPPGGR